MAILEIMLLGVFCVRIYYLAKLVKTVDTTGALGPLFICALYTYGGSRFNAGRDKVVKAEDEIELTTRVEADAGKVSTHCSNSGDDISTRNVTSSRCQIAVKSSIVQESVELK
ncbi:hypothetical protein CMQ_3103 [Grosmannia clavigera kw1407]|uniref:Uncharacterized protein n=1 Tax=Grosmannia clavigera (strain kw1407 / UAMH 11150) TaxID=655863 RepID=F0XH47_GROCL|nr:uncharacterized protein CMQ_3103 [Grosmannia clavigera kw1407]EFX03174.1 hypothetical protein CMQ_3103 [Grosmannia clavigera kw1407]